MYNAHEYTYSVNVYVVVVVVVGSEASLLQQRLLKHETLYLVLGLAVHISVSV